ncbi:MAG: SUMF1/EgtB/PvdO family nonheme iron enzyme [Nitrospinae bacterium]|nr:SUMF1/EgtB/PvdO family nonheme iron enzyme [Nitrospinota bacterium]
MVLRGGSWNNNPNNTRPANRNNNKPGNRNNNNGFRCAQNPRKDGLFAGIPRFKDGGRAFFGGTWCPVPASGLARPNTKEDSFGK